MSDRRKVARRKKEIATGEDQDLNLPQASNYKSSTN